MLMRAQSLLERNPHPDEQTIREYMAGNLCPCGTHLRIIEAISLVAGRNGAT
jgi:nicotinate dehydrogenase subunit A